MDAELQQRGTELDVVAWRREQLVRSGFPRALAQQLACDHCFDLHVLIELAERGCPPEIAVRILAPLGDGCEAA